MRLGLLRAARTALRRPESWGKGDHTGNGKKLSILGALTVVGGQAEEVVALARACTFDDAKDCGLCRAGLGAICPRFHEPRSLARWNDLATTTHADVIALFNRAIAEGLEAERKST